MFFIRQLLRVSNQSEKMGKTFEKKLKIVQEIKKITQKWELLEKQKWMIKTNKHKNNIVDSTKLNVESFSLKKKNEWVQEWVNVSCVCRRIREGMGG